MATIAANVHSLLIPMANDTLLLPNAAVAEIIALTDIEPVENAPEWLLGFINWRGQHVPLLSFEVVNGNEKPEYQSKARIVVFNALGGSSSLPFFATLAQGIPHLIQANQSIVTALAESDEHPTGVLCPVLVEGEPAVIPDLDAMEKLILQHPVLQEQLLSR